MEIQADTSHSRTIKSYLCPDNSVSLSLDNYITDNNKTDTVHTYQAFAYRWVQRLIPIALVFERPRLEELGRLAYLKNKDSNITSTKKLRSEA